MYVNVFLQVRRRLLSPNLPSTDFIFFHARIMLQKCICDHLHRNGTFSGKIRFSCVALIFLYVCFAYNSRDTLLYKYTSLQNTSIEKIGFTKAIKQFRPLSFIWVSSSYTEYAHFVIPYMKN